MPYMNVFHQKRSILFRLPAKSPWYPEPWTSWPERSDLTTETAEQIRNRKRKWFMSKATSFPTRWSISGSPRRPRFRLTWTFTSSARRPPGSSSCPSTGSGRSRLSRHWGKRIFLGETHIGESKHTKQCDRMVRLFLTFGNSQKGKFAQ